MNFCNRCGNKLESDMKFCPKCGNNLVVINQSTTNNTISNKKYIQLGLGIGFGIIFLTVIFVVVISGKNDNYYFGDNAYNEKENIAQTNNNNTSKGKYSTVIVTDNLYEGVEINNLASAKELIVKDSVDQKNQCPNEIKEIENDIISKYGVTAVNLCEMDLDFAREIENVFKKVYEEFPSIRGYITNLTLTNAPISSNYIAAFGPQLFATSDTTSDFPVSFKTQLLLNTTYFLNPDRLQASVTNGSKSGHFPPNATIYSPVAHELGHYISFIALMKHYETSSVTWVDYDKAYDLNYILSDFSKGDYSLEMITEAYEKYKKDHGTSLSLDQWRETVSSYAVAVDNSGKYIYDETIAESFHDVYLNGDNAADASKYIVAVLKQRVGS